MALTFGMETREDTVQFRRRTSFSGTIGRSTINSPSPRKTVLILVRGQSVRARLVRTRSSSCPGGVGFRGIAACGEGASPLPGPLPPRRFSPRSTARVRRGYSAITRTDMGVQQSLNLADSQPGTHCAHGCVRANGASLGSRLFSSVQHGAKPHERFTQRCFTQKCAKSVAILPLPSPFA